jgi:MinD superfamily P-loop ATPase
MSNTIFLIGGGKGGVGKSLMSMAVLDYLHANGQRPFMTIVCGTRTMSPDTSTLVDRGSITARRRASSRICASVVSYGSTPQQ